MLKGLKELYLDAKNIRDKDPASKNVLYVIFLYPGFHALVFHRIAHFLNNLKLGLTMCIKSSSIIIFSLSLSPLHSSK